MKRNLFFKLLIFILITISCKGQSDTSSSIFNNTPKQKNKLFRISQWSEPKKASVLSAILPGAGQVYNKKYWKVPIIYAAGGFLCYNVIRQNTNYIYYKNELLNVINGGTSAEGFSQQQLVILKNQSKKWRDLSVAGVVILYVLNIIDANIDAHLKKFDISDDLSIHIFPSLSPFHPDKFNQCLCGISLKYNLNKPKN